ncbi:MAG TPA: hypothetical protein VMZ28_20720 [Kofleriaceae bacterium]|nr:hypothetical protein [Kofleriaceae bacterium]
MRCALLSGLVALAACMESHAVPCGDLLCPPGGTCDAEHDRCLVAGQTEACAGRGDGADCAHPRGGTGYCDRGACLLASCADDSLAPSEACEPGHPVDLTCTDVGFYRGGEVGCSSFCQLDLSGCSGVCGDGVLDADVEVCERELPPPGGCLDHGFDRGRLGCSFCGFGYADCGTIGWLRTSTGTAASLGAGSAAGDILFALGDENSPALRRASVLRRDPVTGWEVLHQWPYPDGRVLTLRGISAASPTDVWVVGATVDSLEDDVDGVIYHFDGEGWEQTTVPDHAFLAVRATGPGDVHVLGLVGPDVSLQNGTAEVRDFDGDMWIASPLGAGLPVALWASGPDDVYAATQAGAFHDDGTGWEPFETPSGTLRGLHGLAFDEVYIALVTGEVFRFDGAFDGELDYTSMGTPGASSIVLDLVGTAGTGLHVLGEGVAGRTVHRLDGASWSDLTGDLTEAPNALVAVGDSVTLLAENGVALDFGGSAWRRQDLSEVLLDNVSVGWASARDEIFVTTAAGALWRYDGVDWTQQPGITSATAVSGAGGEVFVATAAGLVHRHDGTWMEPAAVSPSALRDLAGTGPDDVVVVGDDGFIARWDGQTWAPEDTPTALDLLSVSCGAGGVCYAAARSAILRSEGAGDSWTLLDVDPGDAVRDLFVSPGGVVWIVGDAGAILRLEDGALVATASGTTAMLSEVFGFADDDVFAVGQSGTILHQDGAGWTRVRPPGQTTAPYRSVTGTPTTVVLMTGDPGAVVDILERVTPW